MAITVLCIGNEIESFLVQSIKKAQKSIHLQLKTFTHQTLFDEIKEAQRRKVNVKLMCFEMAAAFETSNLTLFKRPVAQIFLPQFCIIDEEILLQTSFDWVEGEFQNNFETLTIYTDEKELCDEYLAHFEKMSANQAENAIGQNFYVEDLRFKIKLVEAETNEISQQIADILAFISQFNRALLRVLGDLMQKILALELKIAEWFASISDVPEPKMNYKKAKENYQKFEQNKAESEKKELNTDEQQKLKKLYKEAVKLCHPDKVAEKDKAQAENLFKKLQDAYAKQDIAEVEKILAELKSGLAFTKNENSISDIEILKKMLENALLRRDELKKILLKHKENEPYISIIRIENRDEYFEAQRILHEKKWQDLMIYWNNQKKS